jgi:hypothetical protein
MEASTNDRREHQSYGTNLQGQKPGTRVSCWFDLVDLMRPEDQARWYSVSAAVLAGFARVLSAQPTGSDVGVHAVRLQEECGGAPEPRDIAFMGALEPGWFAGQG